MNWTGTARSNYFHVKDPAKFRAVVAGITDLTLLTAADGRVGLRGDDADSGGWPIIWSIFPGVLVGSDEADDADDDQVSVIDLVADHLADGEVAILMEAGSEGSRYITGNAIAINNRGEEVAINLDDIYDRAKHLGAHMTEAKW